MTTTKRTPVRRRSDAELRDEVGRLRMDVLLLREVLLRAGLDNPAGEKRVRRPMLRVVDGESTEADRRRSGRSIFNQTEAETVRSGAAMPRLRLVTPLPEQAEATRSGQRTG